MSTEEVADFILRRINKLRAVDWKSWSRIARDTRKGDGTESPPRSRRWLRKILCFFHKLLRFFFVRGWGFACIIGAKISKKAWGRWYIFQFHKVTAIRREERWNFPQDFCSLVSPIWRRFLVSFRFSTRHAQALGFFVWFRCREWKINKYHYYGKKELKSLVS